MSLLTPPSPLLSFNNPNEVFLSFPLLPTFYFILYSAPFPIISILPPLPSVVSSPFLLTGTPAFTTMCSFLVSNFSFPLHSLLGASIHLYFISFFELGLIGKKSSLCSSLPFIPSSPFVG